jgi:hypothetical protein
MSQFLLPCNSAARLRGFEDDLHLEGQQFNTVLSIFYVGYALVQVPSYATGKPFCLLMLTEAKEHVLEQDWEALDIYPNVPGGMWVFICPNGSVQLSPAFGPGNN